MSGNFSGANPASHFMFVGRQKSADGGAFISFLIFIHKIKFSMFVDDSIAHFCVFFSSEVTLWLHILQRRYYIRTGNLNPSCRSHARLWLSEKIYTGYKILSEKIRTQIWVQISWVAINPAINLPFVCIVFLCFAPWLAAPMWSVLSSAAGPVDHIQSVEHRRGLFSCRSSAPRSKLW